MGWGSGSELMSKVIRGIRDESPEFKRKLYLMLIPAMQDHDWDTETDCLGSCPVFDAVLRELHPDWLEDESEGE